MVSYENITSDSAVWPALMGINAQLAAISRSIAVVFTLIKKGPQTARLAREILPTPGTPSAHRTENITGIQDSIFKVLSTQALYNGTELVTSRKWVRAVIHEAAAANELPARKTFDETEMRMLFDIMASVSDFATLHD